MIADALEQRICELEQMNAHLRRQLDADSHRHETIMSELALAAERVGDRPLACVIRTVASGQSDLSSLANFGLRIAPACSLHGILGCKRCASLIETTLPLGRREREVLRLLTEGSRTPCIASKLGITIATVEVHRRNIMRTLGLHNIAALTKYAVRQGLSSL